MYHFGLAASHLFDSSLNMSSIVPASFTSGPTSPSKRYPYARPRRATTRPTPKATFIGEPGARFPLQAKKRGHNHSLGSQQIPRNVSTAKPKQQTEGMARQEPITSATTMTDPASAAPTNQTTAYIPLKLPRVRIPPVDPRAFCYGRLADVVSKASETEH